MMQIHERIKLEREKSGLTPEALADKLGVPRTTYLHWEKSTPKPDKIVSVAQALGLSDYYFFIPEEGQTSEKIDIKSDEISDKSAAEKIGSHDFIGITNSEKIITVQAKDLTASYERIIEEKEARRIEAKEWAERAEKEKDRYLRIIEENLTQLLKVTLGITSNLTDIKEDTALGLSYQRAWVEYTAEDKAQGDKKKKDQTVMRMNKLLRSQIDRDQKAGKSSGAHKQSKEGSSSLRYV
jgi:transcriptional regulator with XRE-family HTH domain